ncbi:MAG: hypothetical protein COC19_03235 [SAR86 cluster bacterium]|uniref:Demethoxyubiquinone hydroxylase family protein n=1 Tax=SAR86 cluster bacterium TaxID=2030880 RepID=A0A2A4MPX7_9GAMM|nr:MAG: hypothetical protein COC19_03235 [SAR86 cluster bacterium]
MPEADAKSRAVLSQMLIDEKQHGDSARQAGGAQLPAPIKSLMTVMSKVMKGSTYHI